MTKFTYFYNEEGEFTIAHDQNLIVSVKPEQKAKNICKALNQILKQTAIREHLDDIYGLESNLMDIPHSKEEKAYAKCEIKNHKYRIRDIKKEK